MRASLHFAAYRLPTSVRQDRLCPLLPQGSGTGLVRALYLRTGSRRLHRAVPYQLFRVHQQTHQQLWPYQRHKRYRNQTAQTGDEGWTADPLLHSGIQPARHPARLRSKCVPQSVLHRISTPDQGRDSDYSGRQASHP